MGKTVGGGVTYSPAWGIIVSHSLWNVSNRYKAELCSTYWFARRIICSRFINLCEKNMEGNRIIWMTTILFWSHVTWHMFSCAFDYFRSVNHNMKSKSWPVIHEYKGLSVDVGDCSVYQKDLMGFTFVVLSETCQQMMSCHKIGHRQSSL